MMEEENVQTDQSTKTKTRKGRLIIRNLPFNATEGELRRLCDPYGSLIDVHIPLKPETNQSKGFAFIEYSNKNYANKAIKELNEKKFKNRVMLVDFSVDKRDYIKAKAQTRRELQILPNTMKPSKKSDGIATAEEKEEGNEQDAEKSEEDEIAVEDKKEVKNSKQSVDSKAPKKKPGNNKSKFESENLEKTVFVRNIPFDITQRDFERFFKKLAPISYAKLVINKLTESHNGTGFVKFENEEDAKKYLQISSELKDNNPSSSTLMSLAKNELDLNGRKLIILPALNRKDVGELKPKEKPIETQKKKKPKLITLDYVVSQDTHGKRNLYLAKLGLNKPDEEGMKPDDLKKYQDNEQEKIEKLQNPNYFVSKTTLAFKNVPKRDFDEDRLKEIIGESLKTKYNEKILKKTKILNKVNLLKEETETDENALPKNRGFGFVDFVKHEDALHFLDYITNKPHLINPKKLPIVEFAIDDIRILKKKEKIVEQIKQKAANQIKLTSTQDLQKKKTQTMEKQSKQTLAKLEVRKYLEDGFKGKPDVQTLTSLLNQVFSRGPKQRMKKQLEKKFNIELEDDTTYVKRERSKSVDAEKKDVRSLKDKIQRRKEVKKKAPPVDPELAKQMESARNTLKLIKRTIKDKQKKKRRQEGTDDFEELAANYLKKVTKK